MARKIVLIMNRIRPTVLGRSRNTFIHIQAGIHTHIHRHRQTGGIPKTIIVVMAAKTIVL
jgi:hypothetical protein